MHKWRIWMLTSMQRPLVRNVVVRSHPNKPRQCWPERLEVQIANRITEGSQFGRNLAVEIHRSLFGSRCHHAFFRGEMVQRSKPKGIWELFGRAESALSQPVNLPFHNWQRSNIVRG